MLPERRRKETAMDPAARGDRRAPLRLRRRCSSAVQRGHRMSGTSPSAMKSAARRSCRAVRLSGRNGDRQQHPRATSWHGVGHTRPPRCHQQNSSRHSASTCSEGARCRGDGRLSTKRAQRRQIRLFVRTFLSKSASCAQHKFFQGLTLP